MLPDGVLINLGRIRAARDPGPAVRSAVALQLASADLEPPGLPPAAILLVRRLRDPLPGRVRAAGAIATLDPAWERAVRSRLDDMHRSAVRPEGGRLAEEAEAVLFADPAELLACAAVARAAGGPMPWWLAAAARYLSQGAASVAQCLGADPRLLPAVVARLVAWRRVDLVLARMSDADAETLTERMLQAHDLAVLIAATREATLSRADGTASEPPTPPATTDPQSPPPSPPHADVSPPVSRARGSPAAGPLGGSGSLRLPPPWAPWWSPSSGTAPIAVEMLAGIAVLLHQAPPLVRRPLFALELRRWRQGREAASRNDSPPPPAVADPVPAASGTHSGTPEVRAERRAAGSDGIGPEAKQRPPESDVAAPERADTGETHALEADGLSSTGEGEAVPELRARSGRDAAEMPAAPQEPAGDAVSAWTGEGIATRLGGVLYLINVFERLGLPDAFEPAWRLASAVGGWGLLEAVGRAVLTDGSAEDAADPLWAVLAALDGRRPGEPPRSDGLVHADYRLPPVWLDDAPAAARHVRWAASADRLRLWSSGGFVLLDAAARPGPAFRRARAEAAIFGADDLTEAAPTDAPLAPLDHPLVEDPPLPDALHAWLAATVPFLRWRLALAMGDGADSGGDSLFRLPATLFVTETHVDMVAALDGISLPARLAGLDRSPSWVAGLGRIVLFHFQ